MFANRCYDTTDMGMDMNMNNEMPNTMMSNNMCCPQPSCGCVCPPVMECPQERVCHRQINYEVPHIIPVNTRIVNHHVYRHTYQPCFTCTMEDEVCNVYDKCGY